MFYAHLLYVPDPRWVAYDETIKIIQQQKSPIDLVEAIRMVCQKNGQVKQYIGDRLEQNSNKKLRTLCSSVIDNKRIRRIRVKPVVVQWEEVDQGLNLLLYQTVVGSSVSGCVGSSIACLSSSALFSGVSIIHSSSPSVWPALRHPAAPCGSLPAPISGSDIVVIVGSIGSGTDSIPVRG
jgi:hypothetical protein